MSQSDNYFGESLTYEQVKELLPGFAIGALDVHEMQAVERYLQQHEQLIQYRYDLELSSQAIAYSAPLHPLPTSIKSSLMERVRADVAPTPKLVAPRRPPFVGNPVSAPLPQSAQRSATRSGALPLFPEQTRRTSRWGSWGQGLIGVAAVAATAILLFSNWQLQGKTQGLNEQVAAAQQQLATTQQNLQQREIALASLQTQAEAATTQLTSIQSQVAQAQRDASELKSVNDTLQQTVQQQTQQIGTLTTANRLLTLAGLGAAEQAQGTFFVSNGTVILSLRGLSPVPDDKTYQLWYLPEGGSPEPANLFQVKTDDSTLLTFSIPNGVTTFANIGISIEPASGSSAPTDIVMLSTT